MSATTTAGDCSSRAAESASERRAVIGFKGGQAGFEQLATRDHDDVEARCDVVMPENLTYQSFSAVSLDGAAELFRRRDPQTARWLVVGESEDRTEPAMNSGAVLVDAFEIGATANALFTLELQNQLSAFS